TIWLAFGTTFGLILTLSCYEDARRRSPHNYIFLAVFTLAESYLVGVITTAFEVHQVRKHTRTLSQLYPQGWVCWVSTGLGLLGFHPCIVSIYYVVPAEYTPAELGLAGVATPAFELSQVLESAQPVLVVRDIKFLFRPVSIG
ncbi:hypothetical protein SARC_15966, partial [Sphaeroforma arctica JP610]